jgi:hypothetical protein
LLVINDALAGPPNWITAQANSVGNSFGTMMVSFVIDANNFVVTQTGYVANITAQSVLPFTPGANYFLSATSPGNLSVLTPTSGQVYLPLFKADTTNSGYFFGGSGILLTPPETFATVVSSATILALSNDTRYVMTNSSAATLTLPTAANVGQQIIVDNVGTNDVTIAQNNSPMQQIQMGTSKTTAGSGGSLTSLENGDSVTLTCVVANTDWLAESTIGAIWDLV